MDITFISKTAPKKTHEYEKESYSEIYHVGKYKVKKHIATLLNDSRCIYVDIEINRTYAVDFLPSLYAETDRHLSRPYIKIQTSSYGSLNLEHTQEFIDAYNHALEVAKAIEASDILK